MYYIKDNSLTIFYLKINIHLIKQLRILMFLSPIKRLLTNSIFINEFISSLENNYKKLLLLKQIKKIIKKIKRYL